MSFCLPEASSHIGPVPVSSLDVDLVEGHVNVNGPDISVGFPEGLESGMKILSDGVGAGVPEPDAFDEVEGNGVVAEREGGLEDADHVGEVE